MVLALKYRPKSFSELVGQDVIARTLSLALDTNNVANVYLFSGLRGSGKTSTARIMAKGLLCKNAPTSTPCGECESCKSTNHIDLIELDGASHRGIDDIKDLIEQTKYHPLMAKYKVFIIDEVHMLTTQAFNALLKTLEEPPSYVKFILATTDPQKLPATILSRSQHFRFKPISEDIIFSHLIHILSLENISYEEEALRLIIRAGQGSLRDTLTILDQAIIYSKNNINTLDVSSMLGVVNFKLLDDIFDKILNKGDLKDIVNMVIEYETDSILNEISVYLREKMLNNDIKFDMVLFDRFFRIIADSKRLLSLGSDNKFVLILTFMKFFEALKLNDIDSLIQKYESKEIVNQKVPIKEQVKVEKVEKKDNFTLVKEYLYDKSFEIGECFEKSFVFESMKNNVLTIKSFAKDNCKKILWKYFSVVKEAIFKYHGNIELRFIKEQKVEEKKNDIEMPSSCVANLCNAKDTISSKDLTIDEILKSDMFYKIDELFGINKIKVLQKV